MKYELFESIRVVKPYFFVLTDGRYVQTLDENGRYVAGARTLDKLLYLFNEFGIQNTRIQTDFDRHYIRNREKIFECNEMSSILRLKETNPELFI